MKRKEYFVSRQRQYYNQLNVVEIETNGLDYAGADMLVTRFAGEAQSYTDPREAVNAAISIRDAWRADGADVDGITVGSTGGMGMEGEVFEGTDEDLIAWGQKEYDSLPKCDRCGVLRDKTYTLHGDEDLGAFCSEFCCEEVEQQNYVEEHIDEWREKAVASLMPLDKSWLVGMLFRRLRNRRKVSKDHINRRFRKGRLARAIVNNMTNNEVQVYAYEAQVYSDY